MSSAISRPFCLGLNVLTHHMLMFVYMCVLAFYIIHLHRDNTGSWNPSPWRTRARLFYVVNIIAADDLTAQHSRASAATVLILSPRNIRDSAPEGLISSWVILSCIHSITCFRGFPFLSHGALIGFMRFPSDLTGTNPPRPRSGILGDRLWPTATCRDFHSPSGNIISSFLRSI